MYATRLNEVYADRGRLCVGLDPQPSVLDAWGVSRDVAGCEYMCRSMIEHIGESVAVFKPQSAFFEVFGSAGIVVLEKVLADIRAVGALSILDVKRGDIGSTMDGYAHAYLSPDAPLEADAITLSPYLGYGSLAPALDLARTHHKGVYVLARTSNPDGHHIQLAHKDGTTIAQSIVDNAQRSNEEANTGYVGLVVGGTHTDIGVNLSGFTGSVLVPGIGAQGGRAQDAATTFGDAFTNVLISVSRGLLLLGDDKHALNAEVSNLVHQII